MRNKHYKVFAQRLSDDNINWLVKESKNFGSWNKLFDDLKKAYKNVNHKKICVKNAE